MKKHKILLILLTIAFQGKANSFGSDSLEVKNTLRIFPHVGYVLFFSNDPQVIFASSSWFQSLERGLSLEYMYVLKTLKLGIGADLSFRNDYNWDRFLNTTSTKIYSAFEFGTNVERKFFSFETQLGIMRASLTNKYVFFLGGGPVLNTAKRFKKINISIFPYIEYHAGEKEELVAYDCRVPIYCKATPYTLYYKMISYNLAVQVQYNSFKKK